MRSPSRPRPGGYPAGEWNRYEYLYNRTPLTEVSQAHTPITLKLASGVHIAIHEAALVDYCRHVVAARDGPAAEGGACRRRRRDPGCAARAPFVTPWRTLQIADDAPGLYMSDLILNLNEPNKLGDVSWVKPFKYVGIWWGMHLGTHTWASGAKHGATTAETRRYIDFAAANGFRGVLVEGWNKGWDGDWFARGDEFSFTEPYPDFDLEALAAYAKKKGVRLVGHHETAGNIAVYEKQLGAALDLYQKLGIDCGQDGLCRRCRWRAGAGRGRAHPLRVARRAGTGASSPAGGRRSGEAPHRRESARAHQGHGPAPHLSQLGVARGRARHGIQRLGRSAESARARSQPGFHAHARAGRWITRPEC